MQMLTESKDGHSAVNPVSWGMSRGVSYIWPVKPFESVTVIKSFTNTIELN